MIAAENFDFVEKQIFSMSGEQRRSIFALLSDLIKNDGDPFYSAENMARLRRSVAALNRGEGTPHELVEADA